MKPPIHDLSPVPGRGGNRTNRPGNADVAEMDRQIAELVDRSTHELRLAWRQLYCTEPPRGLSRDLLYRSTTYAERAADCKLARLAEGDFKVVDYAAYPVHVEIPAPEMQTTLKTVEKKPLAADLFEVPAGYREEE